MERAHYIVISDTPPVREAYGAYVLVAKFLDALGSSVTCVLTRQLSSKVNTASIESSFPDGRLLIYPDCARVPFIRRLKSIRGLIEIALAALAFRLFKIKAANGVRIFAFFGANGWFLWIVEQLARRLRLPLDVYLIDDLEESALRTDDRLLRRWLREKERQILERASRVFVISPGYADHLQQKYGISATWLPIPLLVDDVRWVSQGNKSTTRTITFLGAVNFLYTDAIADLLREISCWNTRANGFRITLQILTYTPRQEFPKTIIDDTNVQVFVGLSGEECRRRLQESWAIFLPYSFDAGAKTMVETSFPSKLAECLPAGRPLLAYGPAYSSIVRYFIDNQLEVYVTSKSALFAALKKLCDLDEPTVIDQYRQVALRFHSAHAIHAALQI